MKDFESDPRVVTAVMSQGEPREDLEIFWRNIYLRGRMLYDPDGSVADGQYGQPATFMPASRAFVVAPDQTIALAYFGHHPDRVRETIRDLLATLFPGDLDGDGDVDPDDRDRFLECFTGAGGSMEPSCEGGDLDRDRDIDCLDWFALPGIWTDPSIPLPIAQCPETTTLTVAPLQLSWTPVEGATAYDVVEGDLAALRNTQGDFTVATGGCVIDGASGTSATYSREPAQDHGLWVLVRGMSGDYAMTYDAGGDAQFNSRDSQIAGASAVCP